MNCHEHPRRRSVVLKMCMRYGCDVEGLLRYHADALPNSLRVQCRLMYWEDHGCYFKP